MKTSQAKAQRTFIVAVAAYPRTGRNSQLLKMFRIQEESSVKAMAQGEALMVEEIRFQGVRGYAHDSYEFRIETMEVLA